MSSSLRTFLALPLALAALAACNGDGTISEPPVPDPVADVRFRSTSDLSVGDTSHFVAEAVDSTGTRYETTLTWSTSAPGVAQVSASGVVTGVGVGTATITAKAGKKERSVAVRVEAPYSVTVVAMKPLAYGFIQARPALNNLGHLVGNAEDVGAFRWVSGQVASLAPLDEAWDINDAGQVVGTALVAGTAPGGEPSSSSAAALWEAGDTTLLFLRPTIPEGTPLMGTPYPYATDINEAGDVTGYWMGGTGNRHYTWGGFVVRGGVMTELPIGAVPYDVAEDGTVVGRQYLGAFGYYWEDQRAFVFRDGQLTRIQGNASGAFGVNAAGRVVGFGTHPLGGSLAGEWVGSTFQPFAATSSQPAFARALNASGVVIGGLGSPNGGTEVHAAIWKDGRVTRLNTLLGSSEWNLVEASDINDAGWIAGIASNAAGQSAIVLLKPGS